MERFESKIGEIVSLKGYRQNMAQNPIAEVEAYWEALRGVRTVPVRSEIDPRGIERALDSTFLLERIAPGLARFRLAGKNLSQLMGMEVRGMPLTACATQDGRDDIRDALTHLFEGPKVVTISLLLGGGLIRKASPATMILLPLKSDLGDISRAIGCLHYEGRVGPTPQRFDVTAVKFRDIGPFRTPQPAPYSEKSEAQNAGFAEDGPAFKQERPQDSRGHLRLISNEDLKA